MTDTKTPDHGHRFAVYSPSGVHIGLWADGKIAADVAAESPGNTIEELVTIHHSDALIAAAREQALREAAEVASRHDGTCTGAAVARIKSKAILALITKDQTNG